MTDLRQQLFEYSADEKAPGISAQFGDSLKTWMGGCIGEEWHPHVVT
jgi:hypothetical protein